MAQNQLLEEFKLQIQERLFNEGFRLEDRGRSDTHQRFYLLGNEAYRTPVEGYSFKHYQGVHAMVEEVYRRNEAQENISVRIMCYKYRNSSGTYQFGTKLSYKDSKKKIERELSNFIKQYKEFYETLEVK